MKTPPTPHKEAVEAASELEKAKRKHYFNPLYDYSPAQIITASYSATIARKDDILLEARRQLKNAQHQYHCSFTFNQESTPFDSIITAIENELKEP